jgi:hypothetical protein
MFAEILKPLFAPNTFLRISLVSRFVSLFILVPCVAWGYPCPELLVAANRTMQEWRGREPEAPAVKVLAEWLDRNAHTEVAPDDTATASAFERGTPTSYRALSLTFATNAETEPQKRAAIYDLVADAHAVLEARVRMGELPTGKRLEIVLQHPDSIRCFTDALINRLSLDWNVEQTLLTCAATAFFWPVGVMQAMYQGYRYLWQTQGDPTVLKEMQEVAGNRHKLRNDQVLAMRIQAPTGEDWTLLLLQAPPVQSFHQPEPARVQRVLGSLRRSLFGQPAVAPAQLQPTLVGFLHQGQNDETTPPTPVP